MKRKVKINFGSGTPRADSAGYRIPADYYIFFFISALFVLVAFLTDTFSTMRLGYVMINTSPSGLITDYVALAGMGAALLNSAIMVLLSLGLLVWSKRRPDGRIIAALFLTVGFSLFGKNLFNTVPIVMGVWLYGRASRIPFSELVIPAIVGTTVAPIVSEIAFMSNAPGPLYARIAVAYLVGMGVGFVFTPVMDNVKLLFKNYCLYAGGIAGGFIATMFAGLFRSAGLEIVPEHYWDTSHTEYMTLIACVMAAGLILYGVISTGARKVPKRFSRLMGEKNPDDCDYYAKYGCVCYINVGVMCLVSTSVMLLLRVPINGPVLGGILTISGFAAFGKHLRNTIPILIGSIAAVHFNYIEPTASVNTLAVLFSTGLAPMAGKFGWGWGIVIGFVHVSIAVFIGDVNGGLNLYNNGFAGSFSVLILLPIIEFWRRLSITARARMRGKV